MDCFRERHQPTVSVLPTFTASYDPQQQQQHQQAGEGFDCLNEIYGNAPFPNVVGGGYGDMGFLGMVDPKAAAALATTEGTGLGACKVEPGLTECSAQARCRRRRRRGRSRWRGCRART
ncbi:hypothetical protein ZWY2020_036767 [Hordeum vulgare]|nr:hypothetical protein ZWY2020_036767 [Hordeum vulgare]